ncbi:MAG: hypothetical protein P4L75_00150 [Clostridia bacterium]|nr:hypothetical protein [Clostridia bacterium]
MFSRLNEIFSENLPVVPLETQLAKLSSLGIVPRDGVAPGRILEKFTREELEETPYMMLLAALGGVFENEDGEWLPLSDDIVCLDTECIEEGGIYTEIVRRLCVLSKGALVLTDVSDVIDPDAGTARVSFTCDGVTGGFELELTDALIDTALFVNFNLLLSQAGVKDEFFLHLEDRDMIVIYGGANRAKQLGRLTGTHFE